MREFEIWYTDSYGNTAYNSVEAHRFYIEVSGVLVLEKDEVILCAYSRDSWRYINEV